MQNNKIFYLSWKGIETGPFAQREIKTMLETGKIGLLYSIRTKSTDWKLLKDTDISEYENHIQDSSTKNDSKNDIILAISYLSASLSFIWQVLIIVSIGLSAYLWVAKEKKIAILTLIIAIFSSLTGYFFFDKIIPMLYT